MRGDEPQELEEAIFAARNFRSGGKSGKIALEQLNSLVSKAETRLPIMKEEIEARRLLTKAMAGGSPEDLRFAINIAEHTGLERCEIDRAELLLQQNAARASLQRAMEVGKPRLLEDSIVAAKTAGLREEEVWR